MDKIPMDKVKKGMSNIVPPATLKEQRLTEAAYAEVYARVYGKGKQPLLCESRKFGMWLCGILCEECMGAERFHDKAMAVSIVDAYLLLREFEKGSSGSSGSSAVPNPDEKEETGLHMATAAFMASKFGAGPLKEFEKALLKLKEEGTITLEMDHLRNYEKEIFAMFLNIPVDESLQEEFKKFTLPDDDGILILEEPLQMPSWSVFAWLQAYFARVNHATSNQLQKECSRALEFCQTTSWHLRHHHATYDPELLPEAMAGGLLIFSLVKVLLLSWQDWLPSDMSAGEWGELFNDASGDVKDPHPKHPNAVAVLREFVFLALDLDSTNEKDVTKLKNRVRKTAEAIRIAGPS